MSFSVLGSRSCPGISVMIAPLPFLTASTPSYRLFLVHVEPVVMKSPTKSKIVNEVNDGEDANVISRFSDAEEPSVNRDRVSTHSRISWADMAMEDELATEEDDKHGEEEVRKGSSSMDDAENSLKRKQDPSLCLGSSSLPGEKPSLSRKQREYRRIMNIKRNKEFLCFERVDGKLVNVVMGLELHERVFSAAEQKRIVDFVYKLQEMGRNGELGGRTYSEPQKWMKGKRRVTIQFGCCYNYAFDKNGNPSEILQNETVDPMPSLFKLMIKNLISWHVLPPTCVPDSCVVNMYDVNDFMPPHIDNHNFLRPFCTVSFLSECNMIFGTNLKILGAGEYDGPMSIPIPVGSVIVLNGNAADIAKHCVPSVPSKRISITFRKMDENKRPFSYTPEPELQNLQPLCYEPDHLKKEDSPPKSDDRMRGKGNGRGRRGDFYSAPRNSHRGRRGYN